MTDAIETDITALTVQLLSAFVSNNKVESEELAGLIQSTRAALTASPDQAEVEAPVYSPAVSVRKSLSSPDHILSLIDGKPYKTLKRHLATHGLSPEEYRSRYNLPNNYPLVAPNYSAARRAVAEKIGLGSRPAGSKTSASPVRSANKSKAVAPKKSPRQQLSISTPDTESATAQAKPKRAPKSSTDSATRSKNKLL